MQCVFRQDSNRRPLNLESGLSVTAYVLLLRYVPDQQFFVLPQETNDCLSGLQATDIILSGCPFHVTSLRECIVPDADISLRVSDRQSPAVLAPVQHCAVARHGQAMDRL